MYDLWFSLGAAVMKPGMVQSINKLNPKFKLTKKTQTVLNAGDGKPATNIDTNVPFNLQNVPTAGLLENVSTTSVRDAIAYAVQSFPAAPPISIYTASRFCQFLNIEFDSHSHARFPSAMAGASAAFITAVNAAGGGVFSNRFPAFIGMLLLDNQVFQLIPAPGDAASAAMVKVLTEFGMDTGSTEWNVVKILAQQQGFIDASNALMLGDEDPWLAGCGDLILFWSTHSEYTLV